MRNGLIAIFSVFAIVLVLGCTSPGSSGNSSTNSSPLGAAEKVEVYHFHGTHQCYSCIRLGELAEQTVNTYFKDELDSGRIVFGHVNGELPENYELVMKYGTTSSSLWIGAYIDGEFYKEEDTRVWYKISDEQDFLSYLKGVLEKRLAGDLS